MVASSSGTVTATTRDARTSPDSEPTVQSIGPPKRTGALPGAGNRAAAMAV